jgi:hypothetical protein
VAAEVAPFSFCLRARSGRADPLSWAAGCQDGMLWTEAELLTWLLGRSDGAGLARDAPAHPKRLFHVTNPGGRQR